MTSRSLNDRLADWFPNAVRYAGLFIALYEVLYEKVEHPSFLVLAAGMMGLKDVLGYVRSREGGDK